jgi:hypothetical protein
MRSSQPSKEKIHRFKTIHFFTFSFFMFYFFPPVSGFGSALPTDPDPADHNHSRSGFATLVREFAKSVYSKIASLAFLKLSSGSRPEICVSTFKHVRLLILIPGSKFSRWRIRLVLLSAFNTFGKPHVELVPVK